MRRNLFVPICFILAVLGHQANSALLGAQENDASKSLENANNKGVAFSIQPKEEDSVNQGNIRTLYVPRCSSEYVSGDGCSPCLPGTYGGGGVSGPCVECEPGTYSSEKASLECLPCPANMIAPDNGQSICYPCPKGSFSYDGMSCVHPEDPAPTSPPKCARGYVIDGAWCSPCPPGTYWEGGACFKCNPGTYNSEKASLKCLPCPLNMVAPEFGQEYCYTCPKACYSYDSISCKCPEYRPPTSLPTLAPSSIPTCGAPLAMPTPLPSTSLPTPAPSSIPTCGAPLAMPTPLPSRGFPSKPTKCPVKPPTKSPVKPPVKPPVRSPVKPPYWCYAWGGCPEPAIE